MQLRDIPGIGDKVEATLTRAGITTPEQLLSYYPRTHRYYHLTTTERAAVGDWVMLSATLTRPVSRHTGRLTTQQCLAQDESGSLTLRWFNSPFIVRSVKEHTHYQVLGRLETFAGKKHLVNPTLKLLPPETQLSSTLILPIYTPLGNLKSGHLRNLIRSALDQLTLTDPLSSELLKAHHLLPKPEALANLHFPATEDALRAAIHRLGFDELVSLQSEALALKESISPPTSPLTGDNKLYTDWLSRLPYTPTASQTQAMTAVLADLKLPRAMHRLITGDVGSGKTLVAAAAALWTILSNRRVLVLAPTQILAAQLAVELSKLLPNAEVSLVTRTAKGSATANVIVGTHALLSPKHHFTNVGLVIIDEQHRFGVRDRETLRFLSPTPHLLMLSATPIPRTLAMTALAHLDVTAMSDMPKDRLPVKSYVIDEAKRAQAYHWLRTQLSAASTQQAFIVTPLIEQADNNEESPRQALLSLETELRASFPDLRLDYVHGKMKETEKAAHLEAFRAGQTQLLVATSMIEVGIDIPHANIIFIENAELFGLATLHQLRGRVGRGGGQGHCFLLTHTTDPAKLQKLAYFVREKQGVRLAEYDLSLRGPGDIFGTLQSGTLGLRFADLSDPNLLASSRQVALTLAQTSPNTYNTPI